MFLISALVPYSAAPRRRTETLASQRSEPSSILTSLTPSSRNVRASVSRKATASSALRRSGSPTHSISGTPARLKSTSEPVELASRPSALAWVDLPVSSSRWMRVRRHSPRVPSSRQ